MQPALARCVLVVLPFCVCAACRKSESQVQAQAALQAVAAMQTAVTKGDWGTIYDQLDAQSCLSTNRLIETEVESFRDFNSQKHERLAAMSPRQLFINFCSYDNIVRKSLPPLDLPYLRDDKCYLQEDTATVVVGNSCMTALIHLTQEDGIWKLSTRRFPVTVSPSAVAVSP
jgi:hypothetical protein